MDERFGQNGRLRVKLEFEVRWIKMDDEFRGLEGYRLKRKRWGIV